MISMTAEQKSYLYPEGSEISAADNYITLQGYITSHPEGEKISLCLCGCGEECREDCLYIRGHYARKNNPMYGKHHSSETKEKLRLASSSKTAELASNWKGGISFLPYCSKFNERLKERVRERDDRKCQLCGRTELENGRKLTVHHVHYDKENCYPDLLAVCFSCNSIVNSDRDYWERRCMETLQRRGLLNWKPDNVTPLENIERQGG